MLFCSSGKVTYSSESQANIAIQQIRERGGRHTRVYLCDECKGFHLTSQRTPQLPKRKITRPKSRRELMEAAKAKAKALPAHDQEFLALYLALESDRAVAEQLGIKVGSVRTRVYRLRKRGVHIPFRSPHYSNVVLHIPPDLMNLLQQRAINAQSTLNDVVVTILRKMVRRGRK